MYRFEIGELVIVCIYAHAKEKTCIAAINQLIVSKLHHTAEDKLDDKRDCQRRVRWIGLATAWQPGVFSRDLLR